MLSNKTSEEQNEEWGWFLAQLTVKMWNTRPKACVEVKRVGQFAFLTQVQENVGQMIGGDNPVSCENH